MRKPRRTAPTRRCTCATPSARSGQLEIHDRRRRESRRRGRKRILIELDQKFPLSPTSQFQLVTALPKIGFTAEERIALVHRTPEAQEANQFINLLAKNHGVMVRNFGGVESAKDWLRE
jgi:hypothetical protein